MPERNPQNVIGPDESDIKEVNSLGPNSKPSRLSQLASSGRVRAGGAVIGVSAAVAAVELLKEADLNSPPAVVQKAEASSNELEISNLSSLERRFLLRSVFNPSFEFPEYRIVHVDSRWQRELVGPMGWEAINPANSAYHFREGGAYQGRSFVSGDLVMIDGCVTEGGGWEQDRLMRINPDRTYPLSYRARYHDVTEGVTALSRSQIDIFNSQGDLIGSNTVDSYFSVGEGDWEQINPVVMGPEGVFDWPENAASARISVSASGETSGDACEPGKIATVDFDDVSFRP